MRTLVVIILALPLAAASAATITVNTTADNTIVGDGQCTLREAVANVNAAGDTTGGDCAAGTGTGDTITFALSLPAKIKLVGHGSYPTPAGLVITRDVSIRGPAPTSADSLHISRQLHGYGWGGIFWIGAGTTNISDLTIEHGFGDVGGGIHLGAATLTVTNCRLTHNLGQVGGGAIGVVGGTLTLSNSTLDRNRTKVGAAFGGAGIFNLGGSVTLTNSTLTRNRAAADGAGIANGGGSVTLTNCTLDRNAGGTAIVNALDQGLPFGTITLINTVVANSRDSFFIGQNCGGPIVSGGHNLSSDGTCFTSGGSDLIDTDPLLAPLAHYGGPTETLALCTGRGVPNRRCRNGTSPAIDAGDDTVTGPPDNLSTDQRGLPRPAGLHVDIGAYEVQ